MASAYGRTGAPSGMNCGNSARKNTASFGLARAVSSPLAKSRLAGSRSAAAASLPRSAWTPNQTRTATPAIFRPT